MARVSRKQNVFLESENISKAEADSSLFKTALYVRLSVEDNGKESDSLEAQLQMLRSYAKDKPQHRIVEEYIDNGFSGTNYDRPSFKKMFEDVQAEKINCIIVKDLSRLGRNYIETGKFLQIICPMYNLRVIAINDNYDSTNATGAADMTMSFMNIANDMYAKDISKKECTVLQNKMEKGEFIGNYAPYGYWKDPENKNHLVPDEVAAPIVNRIFQMRADGIGYASIIRTLNGEDIASPGRYRYEHGIFTNNNKKGEKLLWNLHVLKDILANEVYIGNMVQGRCQQKLYEGIPVHWTDKEEWIKVENTHEPIVPKELFDEVQEINRKCAEKHKANNGKYSYLPKTDNPYGKKLKCADCGMVIKLVRSFNTQKTKAYFTFKCSHYITQGESACTSKAISQKDLDDAVIATLQAHINIFSKYNRVISKVKKANKNDSKHYQLLKSIQDVGQKIRQKENLQMGLYTDMKEGLLTEEEYLFNKETLSKEIQNMEQQLADMRAEISKKKEDMNQFEHWKYLVKKYKKIKKIDKKLVDDFIEEIRLYDDQKLDITLKYMSEFNAAKTQYEKLGEEVA